MIGESDLCLGYLGIEMVARILFGQVDLDNHSPLLTSANATVLKATRLL